MITYNSGMSITNSMLDSIKSALATDNQNNKSGFAKCEIHGFTVCGIVIWNHREIFRKSRGTIFL